MGSKKSKVCVFSTVETDDLLVYGRVPNCEHHEHMSYNDALELTHSFLYKTRNCETGETHYYFEANWVDSKLLKYKSIVFTDPRTWAIVESGIGMHTHQLVPIGR